MSIACRSLLLHLFAPKAGNALGRAGGSPEARGVRCTLDAPEAPISEGGAHGPLFPVVPEAEMSEMLKDAGEGTRKGKRWLNVPGGPWLCKTAPGTLATSLHRTPVSAQMEDEPGESLLVLMKHHVYF